MTLQEAVKNLYDYRDFFFEDHSSELADKKTELLAEELNKTLKLFDEKEQCDSDKNTEASLLKARALNVLPEYSPEALDILTKLVKFHPRLWQAWNELGVCFWKRNDLNAAKRCFENALREEKNAESLQHLCMILKQLGETPEEKQKNIAESLEKAKEAVNLNSDDGKSWYLLGNSNLSLFFGLNQSPSNLKESIAAYDRASKDKAMKCHPDLYYNWAVALKFDENYKLTLEKLELSMKYDPLWNQPKEELESLLNHLKNVQLMISTKGKLKTRKIRELINALKKELDASKPTETFINSIGRSETYVHSKMSDLQEGSNTGKMLKGKVACHVYWPDSLSFTFCLLDDKEDCYAVNVYNMAEGKGVIIGDSVVILDPCIQHFNFVYKDNNFAFCSIRVNSPLQLVVNKRRFGRDTVSTPSLSVTVTSE